MEIHELNTFSGTPGSGDYLATDNGSDTSKISVAAITNPLNERIDNIIAGPAPSAQEVTDARLGATVLGGKQYSSLGDAVRGQTTELFNDLATSKKYTAEELAKSETITINKAIVFDSWELDATHGYGKINSEFVPTDVVDKVLIYNTATFAGYINYYDESKTRITYTYVGNDNQYAINKSYPYFKFWFYKKDQSSLSDDDMKNLRFEKACRISDVVTATDNNISNLIRNNGVWDNDLEYIIGGYSFAASRINNPIFASASLSRIRNTVPIIVKHDNAIIKGAFDMTYQMMYGKVDNNDVLQSYGGYVRTAILPKGIYYLLFKKADGSAVTDSDLSAIVSAFSYYSYFDDNAVSINYPELFCLNWYAEANGKVNLGDQTWTNFNANHTSVVIPEFYTDHKIYIRNNDLRFRWRNSVSDQDKNITHTTGYIDSDSLIEVPAGYHHIMVTRAAGSSLVDFEAMSEALTIYATRTEVNSLADSANSENVVSRNMDMQNALYALRKSDRYGNNLSRTIFLAHATDSHGDVPRWNNFLEAIGYYDPELVVHTGDMVNYTMLSDTTHFLNNLPEMPVLLAIGNHETGVNHDIGDGGATNATLFNDLIEPLNEKYNLGATHTYYSYDVRGIRFIVLNVYDYDANDGTSFVDRSHIYYSQAQVSWFINQLKDANTNNIPVVVCAHECDVYLEPSYGGETPFNQTYEMERFYSKTWEGNPICDIIEAFINGTTISQTYNEGDSGITLTVNETFSNEGHFVTWLVGHRHADFMGFLPDYSQLVISPCATACSIDSPNSTGGYSDLPRREEERCEDAFNLYMINPSDKTIGIVRFGSNINFDLRVRNHYKTSYIKSI